jgi:hypothetical protein
LRAAGGRGHRIILATISAQKSATYTAITVVVIRQQADEKTRFRNRIGGGKSGGARRDHGELGLDLRHSGRGGHGLGVGARRGAEAREEREAELRNK